MKAKDFREMTTEELNTKLKDLKVELFNLRFSHATGSIANPMSLNTISERELNKTVKGSN